MPCLNPHGIKPFLDGRCPKSLQIPVKDHPHRFRFLRHDLKAPVHVAVTKKRTAPWFPFLKILLDAPFLVLACRPALLLCVGCQDGQHEFSVRAHRVDVLLFKINIHTHQLQFPHRLQKRNRIPGKPGNRLGQYHIDLPCAAVGKQPHEIFPGILCAGLCLIRIDPGILPFPMALDQFTVIADLRRQRMEHGVLSG